MAQPFLIEEHTFEGQHIREHPRALASSQEDTVWLHAKSYTPHDVADGSAKGDLTIIAFHANSFHKEVYEPFFEALYRSLKQKHGLTVGSIWIADQSNQGTSGLLNDGTTGNDPSWFDHSRDIVTMTNIFRKRMKRPIVAVGHSMGGTQAVATAHLHPRLFEAVVLIDAVISKSHSPASSQMMKYALHLPETHDSREQAEKAVRKSPVFKGWDRRVIQRYIETGFHSSPTATCANEMIKPITTKHAEASTLLRSKIEQPGLDHELYDDDTGLRANSNTHPKIAWSWLPTLQPSACFIHGEGSRVCREEEMEERTNITGTAVGGSGGIAQGRVTTVSTPGGHFAPMTNPESTAETVGAWLSEEIPRFRRREVEALEGWRDQDMAEKQRVDPAVQKRWHRYDGKEWLNGKSEQTKSRL